MNWLQRFMLGRHGSDHLNRLLLALALGLMLVQLFTHWAWLLWLTWALLLWSAFRMLSRNHAARLREEARYLTWRNWLGRWAGLQRRRWRERRTHQYFSCPRCGQTLRAPKNQGNILVTCAKCGHQFQRRT